MFSTYERPTMIERGSFAQLTQQRKRGFRRDRGWFGRRRRRCGDGDWDD
jgi:hypothetical protein